MDHLIKRIINETIMDTFINSMFSDLELNNLESMVIKDKRGPHKISVGYFNPHLKKMVFRVVEPFESLYWDSDDPKSRIVPISHPKSLYIREDVYHTIMDYIPNKKMVIDWFNERYDQDVEDIIPGGPHIFV